MANVIPDFDSNGYGAYVEVTITPMDAPKQSLLEWVPADSEVCDG